MSDYLKIVDQMGVTMCIIVTIALVFLILFIADKLFGGK